MAINDNQLATYSPMDVSVILTQTSTGLVYKVKGFAEDALISVQPQTDTSTLYTGADNFATRVFSGNRSGTINLSLQQTSPSNDVLSQLYENDQASRNSDSLFSIFIKDSSGRSQTYSAQCFISRLPDVTYQASMHVREWQMHCINLHSTIAGNSKLTPDEVSALASLGITVPTEWQV